MYTLWTLLFLWCVLFLGKIKRFSQKCLKTDSCLPQQTESFDVVLTVYIFRIVDTMQRLRVAKEMSRLFFLRICAEGL